MLRLNISNAARKFIETRIPKHRIQIIVKILELRNDPEPNDSIHLKGSDYRRADIGEYRILYKVSPGTDEEEGTLNIANVGKRNDDEVYRRFARK